MKTINIYKKRLIRWLIGSVVLTITKTELIGIEKLKNVTGKAIVATNHLGILDPFYAFIFVKRDDNILLVAERHKKNPFFVWLVAQLDLIWIDRERPDLSAMKAVLKLLDEGGILFLAPEGTRSKSHKIQRPKNGAAYIASKSGAPIFPVALSGTEDSLVLKCFKSLSRPRIKIVIGDPFISEPLPSKNREAHLNQTTDEIMVRIAALLPEKYHGVYANHPRLRQEH